MHHLLKKDTVLHSPVIVFNIPSGTFYEAVSTFPVPHRTHLPHTGTDPSEIPALFLKCGSESYPSSGNRNGSFPVSEKRVSASPGSPSLCRLSRFSMKDPSPFPERWTRPFPSEQKAKSATPPAVRKKEFFRQPAEPSHLPPTLQTPRLS